METKMLEQLAQPVLSKEILERFLIVKIDTDEADIVGGALESCVLATKKMCQNLF